MNAKSRKTRLPVIVLGLAVSSVGLGAFALVRNFLATAPAPQKVLVQEIHLIRPPPPPPDLPPPPPPPPDEKVNVPEDKPDQSPSNQPPPGQQLGLDADGSAGGDEFGLAAHKGGRDLIGEGGSAFAWYAGLLKSEILDQLNAERRVRSGEYSVVVRVWVRNDGSVDHIRIVQSSGSRERDQAIETALARISRLSQAPPADMPEPISLRIVSRG
jgi:protein TonB